MFELVFHSFRMDICVKEERSAVMMFRGLFELLWLVRGIYRRCLTQMIVDFVFGWDLESNIELRSYEDTRFIVHVLLSSFNTWIIQEDAKIHQKTKVLASGGFGPIINYHLLNPIRRNTSYELWQREFSNDNCRNNYFTVF